MNIKAEVKWKPGAIDKLKNAPDKVIYSVARQTLDMTLPHIPKDTGTMRKTSMAAGVRGNKGNYYIGSYTDYAIDVWKMGAGTNWSEPDTFGKWYEQVYKKKKDLITNIAIRENKLK